MTSGTQPPQARGFRLAPQTTALGEGSAVVSVLRRGDREAHTVRTAAGGGQPGQRLVRPLKPSERTARAAALTAAARETWGWELPAGSEGGQECALCGTVTSGRQPARACSIRLFLSGSPRPETADPAPCSPGRPAPCLCSWREAAVLLPSHVKWVRRWLGAQEPGAMHSGVATLQGPCGLISGSRVRGGTEGQGTPLATPMGTWVPSCGSL